MPFPFARASHAEPFEPGKGSNRIVRRREHGKPDRQCPYRASSDAQPSVQPPAGCNEGASISGVSHRRKANLRDRSDQFYAGPRKLQHLVRGKIVQLAGLRPPRRTNLDQLGRELLRRAQGRGVLARHSFGAHRSAQRSGIDQHDANVRGVEGLGGIGAGEGVERGFRDRVGAPIGPELRPACYA